MANFTVFEIRPTDGGAWARVIIDLPARHDPNLSESIEVNLFISNVLDLSLSDIVTRAEMESRRVVASVSGV